MYITIDTIQGAGPKKVSLIISATTLSNNFLHVYTAENLQRENAKQTFNNYSLLDVLIGAYASLAV